MTPSNDQKIVSAQKWPRASSDRLFLCLLIAAQVAVQTVLFLAANHYGTLLTYPVVDEWEYWQTARHFVFWNFDLGVILWHPPLYAAFLAVAIKWTGVAELLWLKSLNIALFAGTIPLMHALLLHLWPERIIRARILTALWAFYPLNLLFNLTLLGTALYSLLTISTLYFAFVKPRPLGLWLCCLLAAYCRYYSLALGPLVVWTAPAFSRRLKAGITVAILAGIAWLPWHNYRLTGHWFLDPQTFSNFYVGNSDDVRATMEIRPMDWRKMGATLAPYEGRISRRLRELSPRQILVNTLKKTHYLVSGYEISRNRDLGRIAAEAGIRLPGLAQILLRLPFALLFAAALVGLLERPSAPATRRFQLCAVANLFAMGIVMLFFFPTARYRLYWIPFLFLLAAAGPEIWSRRRVACTAVFFVALCLPNLPFGSYPVIPPDEENVHLAYRALQIGDVTTLARELPRLTRYPSHQYFLQGGLRFLEGDPAGAETAYQAALASDPDQWEAHWKLFLLSDLAGNSQAAAEHLHRYQAVNLNHLAPGATIGRAISRKRFDILQTLSRELPPRSEEALFIRQAATRFAGPPLDGASTLMAPAAP